MSDHRKYDDDEVGALTGLWEGHVAIEKIAKQLRRSPGSIAQKALKLGLRRDRRLTHYVTLHGRHILEYGSAEKIAAVLAASRGAKKAEKNIWQKKREKSSIDHFEKLLKSGFSRNSAIIATVKFGASQIWLARHLGITKQAVNQIIKRGK